MVIGQLPSVLPVLMPKIHSVLKRQFTLISITVEVFVPVQDTHLNSLIYLLFLVHWVTLSFAKTKV